VIICCIVCVPLLFKSLDFVIVIASSLGMLTDRSFMLYVINLCFLFIFKFVRSVAKFVD